MSELTYVMLPLAALVGSGAFLYFEIKKRKPSGKPSGGGSGGCAASANAYVKQTGKMPPDLNSQACCPIWHLVDGSTVQLDLQNDASQGIVCEPPYAYTNGLSFFVQPQWGGNCCHTKQ